MTDEYHHLDAYFKSNEGLGYTPDPDQRHARIMDVLEGRAKPPDDYAGASSLDERVPVRITNYQGGLGVKIEVDGQELRRIRDLRFSCLAENDFMPHLVVDMLVTEPVVIDVTARITINVIPPVGCVFTEMKSHDGTRKMVTVKRPYDV